MKKYRANLIPKCSPECLVFRTASCHCLTRGQRCKNQDGGQDGRRFLLNFIILSLALTYEYIYQLFNILGYKTHKFTKQRNVVVFYHMNLTY